MLCLTSAFLARDDRRHSTASGRFSQKVQAAGEGTHLSPGGQQVGCPGTGVRDADIHLARCGPGGLASSFPPTQWPGLTGSCCLVAL